MAALWMLHGSACVRLLRAHGRTEHADGFAAALRAVAEIVAGELGLDTLNAAMDWASNQLWGGPETASAVPPGKGHLN
jgi:hypothetical protein